MVFFILILIVINLFIIDYACVVVINKYKKSLNIVGNLNFNDLDNDFWKED